MNGHHASCILRCFPRHNRLALILEDCLRAAKFLFSAVAYRDTKLFKSRVYSRRSADVLSSNAFCLRAKGVPMLLDSTKNKKKDVPP